ncbi:hypothetical protein XM38_039080 [Halomicronema hongdechloris C2206]|uniref:Uncharacterized protein n=1 Tax=Halomicronema hongdechloris C2206 TaxID=1641165 RepID=A0A1Z3HRN9_9CYAN|nr:hypothetical protein XM38_039080 [Halomicronema hongdechloris C2206]
MDVDPISVDFWQQWHQAGSPRWDLGVAAPPLVWHLTH